MKFKKDKNNFLPCLIEYGQILKTLSFDICCNLVHLLLSKKPVCPAMKVNGRGLTSCLLMPLLVVTHLCQVSHHCSAFKRFDYYNSWKNTGIRLTCFLALPF